MLGLLISEKGSFDYLLVRVNHSLNSFLPKTVQWSQDSMRRSLKKNHLGLPIL